MGVDLRADQSLYLVVKSLVALTAPRSDGLYFAVRILWDADDALTTIVDGNREARITTRAGAVGGVILAVLINALALSPRIDKHPIDAVVASVGLGIEMEAVGVSLNLLSAIDGPSSII